MQHSVSENVFTGKNIKTIIRLFLVTVVLHDHHPPNHTWQVAYCVTTL